MICMQISLFALFYIDMTYSVIRYGQNSIRNFIYNMLLNITFNE